MRRALSVVLVLLATGTAYSDEGMWMPEQLPEVAADMAELGLELEASELGDLGGRLLGAVVWLGGCTASFVSPEGLVITNHHCAYGSLQFNSTAEDNVLRDGFLAAQRDEELAAGPGSRVLVAVETTDVTEKVLGAVPDGADGYARHEAIEKAEKSLVAACESDPGHRCRVSSFWGGMLYVLTKQLEIRDVRLVYAPASAIGKYGGDIDNWMWPRHTGDFAFLRAYVGPDGASADPAPENVPFRPRHWLEIGVGGVEKSDFVMVPGYPGSTNRYRLADEVRETFEWEYPNRRARLAEILEIIDRETQDRPEARLKYAAIMSYVNNALKNTDGMLAGYARSDMLERKMELEKHIEQWIAENPDREAQWAGALSQLRSTVEEQWATRERDAVLSGFKRGTLMASARTLVRLAYEQQLPDIDRQPGYQERDLARIEAGLMRVDRSYDPQVDRALFENLLVHAAELPENQRIAVLDARFGLDEQPLDLKQLATELSAMYAETGLGNREIRMGWVGATPEELAEAGDPMIDLALALSPDDRQQERQREAIEGRLLIERPRAMKAITEYQRAQGTPVYPDANATLRVTYGSVAGYEPRDGVWNLPFTTGEGILAKDTGTEPFDAPARLLDALRDGPFSPYTLAQSEGLPVNFLSTVDTTGGNSGSPTLDGRGRLVGLLFDGNWESIIADWDFLPEVTRSIHVDIRYVLWIMDRVDGAWNLLREMGVEPQFEEKRID